MKKTSLIAATVLTALISSCNSSAPKADMKTDIDSLSYSIGIAQTQGMKEYLAGRVGVDTAYIDEFVKGLNEAAQAVDDKKKNAYYTGVSFGLQIGQNMYKGLNHELFGEDSTQTVSINNLIAGVAAGITGNDCKMTMEEAQEYTQTHMEAIKNKQLEKTYGDNKKAGEEYLAKIAKAEGVKKLANGVYYKVITEGKGAVPADTSRVKVNYEGKLIDGTVFDSSYERKEPTSFRCNQVIPGWTEALTHMPVGSTWEVYIPQEQAYGGREAGKIKPFSALTFKIELLGIEK